MQGQNPTYPVTNRTNTLTIGNLQQHKISFFLVVIIWVVNICSIQAQEGIKENGYNKIYYDNGQLASEGFSKDGKPNGYWKTYYPNGNLKTEGNREGYQLSGIWKFYNQEGELTQEITYSEGKKNGPTRKYDEQGRLREKIPYQKDTIQGTVESYYANGEYRKKTPYVAGMKNGEERIYEEDGRVIWLVRYEKNAVINREAINRYAGDGEKTGLWITFHPNEVKKLEGNYVNGQRNGIWKEYDEKGKLLNIYEYKDGQLADNETALNVIDQEKYYYPNGQVKRVETRQGNKRQGFTKTYDKDGNLILSQIFRNDTLVAEGNQNNEGKNVGLWKYYWPNGNLKSTGNYKNGLKDGAWKYYFRNGELEQEGFWKSGKLDGEWIWYFKDGKKRCIMHFEDGVEEGDYIEWDQYNYVVAEGEYKEGYRVGKWLMSGGDYIGRGKYRDGLKDGEWVYYYYEEEPESLIFRGEYQDGEPDGRHTYYYQQNIPRYIHEYKAGLKNGTFVWFFEDGAEQYRITYELDEIKSVNGIPFRDIDNLVE